MRLSTLFTCRWCEDADAALSQLREVQDEMRRLHDGSALTLLRGARVIGCTTTGAANWKDQLHDVAPAVRQEHPVRSTQEPIVWDKCRLDEITPHTCKLQASCFQVQHFVACNVSRNIYRTRLHVLCLLQVCMVEEAGELLEAHVLTSMSPATKHLIMVRSLLVTLPIVVQPSQGRSRLMLRRILWGPVGSSSSGSLAFTCPVGYCSLPEHP